MCGVKTKSDKIVNEARDNDTILVSALGFIKAYFSVYDGLLNDHANIYIYLFIYIY